MKKFTNVSKNIRKLYKENPLIFNLIGHKNLNVLVSTYWLYVDKVKKVDDLHEATPADSIIRAYYRLIKKGVINV